MPQNEKGTKIELYVGDVGLEGKLDRSRTCALIERRCDMSNVRGEGERGLWTVVPWVVARVWTDRERRWCAQSPGVECSDLHRHADGGGAALFRMRCGATIPEHNHVLGEHTYVIEGRIRFGSQVVEAGDAMWTEPGERHDVEALTDAMFVGVAPVYARAGEPS